MQTAGATATDSEDDAFRAVLARLHDQHEAQVGRLRAEVTRLQAAMGVQGCSAAQPSDSTMAGPRARPGSPMPSPPADDDQAMATSFADVMDCGKTASVATLSSFKSERKLLTGYSADFSRDSDDIVEEHRVAMATSFPMLEKIQCAAGMNRMSTIGSVSGTVRNQLFALDGLIGVAIIANTALLGISADVNPDWIGWIVVDAIFATLFLIELLIKIYIHGRKKFFWGKERFTHYCEVLLVPLAVLEVLLTALSRETTGADSESFLTLFGFIRLFRVFRVVRVLRLDMFAELKVMILGAVGGLRTLMWSIMLIILPVYALSLILRESLGKVNEVGEGAEYFSSVPRSFFSVFRCVVMGDCADRGGRPLFVLVSDAYGWGFALLYSVTAVVMSFGLFNVIAAMFVENVVMAAKNKARLARRERLMDHGFFARKVAKLLALVCEIHDSNNEEAGDSDDDPSNFIQRAAWTDISPETFELVRHDERVQRIFDDLDLADEDQMNLFTMLDADGSGSVSLEEICSGIAKLRGEACRSDIISINLMMQDIRVELRSALSCLMRRINRQQDMIKEMCGVTVTDVTASRATSGVRSKSIRKLVSD